MIPLSRLKSFAPDRLRLSPNHGKRTAAIKYVILHATAGSDEGAESWMTNEVSRVSAHLHIRRDGSVTRHVADELRAWHAGVGSWLGDTDINTVSLGWEIGNRNDGQEPYTAEQYLSVARLLAHYLPQGLARDAVLSHAQIAPGRKTDPLKWDWPRMWETLDVLTGRFNGPMLGSPPAPVYSPYLGDWLVPVRVRSDSDWSYVTWSAVRALPATAATTPLSRMPATP